MQGQPGRLAGGRLPEPDRPVVSGGGHQPAVGAEGHGLDRAGVLPADPERVDPGQPSGEVPARGPLEVGVAGVPGAGQAPDQPEQAVGDVPLLGEGLAVVVGQHGGHQVDLPKAFPRSDLLGSLIELRGGLVLVDGQADRQPDRRGDRQRGQPGGEGQRGPPPEPTPDPLGDGHRPGPDRVVVEEPAQVVGQLGRRRVPSTRLQRQPRHFRQIVSEGPRRDLRPQPPRRDRSSLRSLRSVSSGVSDRNGGAPASIS